MVYGWIKGRWVYGPLKWIIAAQFAEFQAQVQAQKEKRI